MGSCALASIHMAVSTARRRSRAAALVAAALSPETTSAQRIWKLIQDALHEETDPDERRTLAQVLRRVGGARNAANRNCASEPELSPSSG